MVLALSAAATTMIIVAVIVLIIWAFVFFSVIRDRTPKTPVPANLKPYLEDDALETRRLERVLQVAVVVLVITALAMGAIFVYEPSRQAEAFEEFEDKAVERGETIFGSTQPDAEGHAPEGAFGCADCHGPGGTGGSTTFTITDASGEQRTVTWSAPALNTVLLRFSEDEVRRILVYGRPGTPMPPWGIDGGGSMTPQMIEDLLAYLESIQLPPDEVKTENADAGLQADGTYDGAELFDMFCARCHTAGYSYGEPGATGGGALGPSLRAGASVGRFPDIENQIEFVNEGSEFEVPYGNQGIGSGRMPGFMEMLLPEQIRAIVEFERGLTGGEGAAGGDESGTTAGDVDEDVPGGAATSEASEEQQQIDEGDE